MTPPEVHRALGVRDTGERDEGTEQPISGAQLPDGWYVVFLNNLEHPLCVPAELARLSRAHQVIGAQIEEHVMFSRSFCWSGGKELWSVHHSSEEGIYHVEVAGLVPHAYQEIHARLKEKQDAEGGVDSDTDYIFDVPVELAESITGYRHYRWKFSWGEPVFNRLEAQQAVPGDAVASRRRP